MLGCSSKEEKDLVDEVHAFLVSNSYQNDVLALTLSKRFVILVCITLLYTMLYMNEYISVIHLRITVYMPIRKRSQLYREGVYLCTQVN